MKIRLIWEKLSLLFVIYTMLFLTAVTASAVEDNKEEISPQTNDSENRCALSTDEYAEAGSFKVSSRLWELLFGKGETQQLLVPGGNIFGVKIKQKNVTVAESKSIPLLSHGDVILSINGKTVSCVEDVRRIVSEAGEGSVTIKAIHGGKEITIEARPTLKDGEYKLGLALRDGAVGIGTVTFVDPETGLFGGLGHGICDSQSGNIIELESGDISGVVLGGIHKGECGKPGELYGILTGDDHGDLNINCECGVFGKVTDTALYSGDAIPIGSRGELHNGEATIYSTLKNGNRAEYKIEIYDIDPASDGSKSFKIRVTDPTLIALTGGIVRGMSGSPIIQNGKLVGAVTHVLVANPTEGYGIFIENMLNAAESQAMPKAA